MALKVIDFIHTKDMPEKIVDFPADDAEGQISVRELNACVETGAKSLVVTLPSGFHADGGYWSCDLEVLLLEGALTIGSEALERYGYIFAPMGVKTAGIDVAESGATLLVFTSGPARMTGDPEGSSAAPKGRLVGPVHVADIPWEAPKTPDFPAGAARKTLRDDPASGQGFWVLGVLPHWSSPMTEWHEFTEENYILEGSIETAAGLMEVGCYLSHAAGEDTAHGPMRSRYGSLLITRAQGPLETTYEPSNLTLPGEWR